jgi:hypothetical protein
LLSDLLFHGHGDIDSPNKIVDRTAASIGVPDLMTITASSHFVDRPPYGGGQLTIRR